MAKTSSVEKNNRRRLMTERKAPKRKELKAIIADKTKPLNERMQATLKLAQMPRNSSATRIRNRCEITGRARGFYRKLKLSRNQLREMASQGLIPGMVKSSW
jgi:small subunit ribosomal protein S14